MDKIDEKRAEVQEQARRFIVRCDPPCEGCEVEVEEVVAAADAHALEAFDGLLAIWQRHYNGQDCDPVAESMALRERLAPRKGEEGEDGGPLATPESVS